MARFCRNAAALLGLGLVITLVGVLPGAGAAAASTGDPPVVTVTSPVATPPPGDIVIMLGGTASYERRITVGVGTTFSLVVYDDRATSGYSWVAKVTDDVRKIVAPAGMQLVDLPCAPPQTDCGDLLYLNFKALSVGTVTIVLERGTPNGSVVTNVIRLVIEVK